MVQKMTTKDLRFAPDPGIYCPKCEKTKAAYEFAINRRSKSGRQGYCKRCNAAYQKLRAIGSKSADKTERKVRCCRCKKEKPTSEFHKDSNRYTGVQSYCKACKSIARARVVAEPKVSQDKSGSTVEIMLPKRTGFFDRLVGSIRLIRFIFGGWLIR